MKKKITKSQVYQASLQKQQELIDSFEQRVNELKEDAYSQNQSASQSENRTTGKVELLSTQERELGFVRLEMDYLNSINPETVNSKIEPGAVVITNLRNFFIAVSSEKMEINGEIIYGISTKAPIYSVMQGLTKGHKFEYNGTAYEIEDLY